jgi:hypothetical protein
MTMKSENRRQETGDRSPKPKILTWQSQNQRDGRQKDLETEKLKPERGPDRPGRIMDGRIIG